jgi:uncharacterized membrane protein YkvA (DUF1232 family)
VDGAGLLVGVIIGLLAAWTLLVALLWILRPRDVSLSELVAFVPDLVRLVRALIADRSAPVAVRAALVLLLVWLISPIDLIPDFVPVLGALDDVAVAVIVLRFVRRRVGIDALHERWPGSEAGFGLLERMVGTG